MLKCDCAEPGLHLHEFDKLQHMFFFKNRYLPEPRRKLVWEEDIIEIQVVGFRGPRPCLVCDDSGKSILPKPSRPAHPPLRPLSTLHPLRTPCALCTAFTSLVNFGHVCRLACRLCHLCHFAATFSFCRVGSAATGDWLLAALLFLCCHRHSPPSPAQPQPRADFCRQPYQRFLISRLPNIRSLCLCLSEQGNKSKPRLEPSPFILPTFSF